jgi:poly-gamma-glutamate capsule biosynthesis protein CapA/YwtB (metallophosphatase superfamily)
MSKQATCAFGAVGDIALSGPTARQMHTRGDDWPFAEVLPALARADVLFGNLESVLIPDDFPDALLNRRGLVARGHIAPSLERAGFDLVSAANNHVLDGGTTGLFHTARALTDAGVLVGGIGATQEEARGCVVVERNGLRFGFLCYAEDSNYVLSTAGPGHAYYTPEAVLEDIARVRTSVDVVVVSVHADLEFSPTPSPARRDAFREFARQGATLVLGHHPHVVQGVERIGSSLIAYSLGNFVFHAHTSTYMRAHAPATAESFILLVEVSAAGVEEFDRVPVLISAPPDERPTLASGEDAHRLRVEFDRLDTLVADDVVVARNWRSLALEHLRTNVRALAEDADDSTRLLSGIGRMLYVAENQGWIAEAERAARELWELQRQQVHEFQRPSFASERAPTFGRLLLQRGRSALRRMLR